MLDPGIALAAGRAAAEQLMVDSCTITRVTGYTTDPDTGVVTPTSSTVYTGACKVQKVTGASARDVGQAALLVSQLEVHIPVTETDIQLEDKVTVTASTWDPELVGRVFRVRGLAHKTFLTARRLAVEEVGS